MTRITAIKRFRLIMTSAAATLVLVIAAWAQQVPIPATAPVVPGPAAGTPMTKPYLETVGRMAYMWGWALVNMANRSAAFSKAPEPGLLGGVVPVAFESRC
jgi:hypothetical protein